MDTRTIESILKAPRQMSTSFYQSKITSYPEVGGFLAMIFGGLFAILGILAGGAYGMIIFGLLVGGCGYALYKYTKTNPDPKTLEKIKNIYDNAPVSYAAVVQKGNGFGVIVYSPDATLGHDKKALAELASRLHSYRKTAQTEDEKKVAALLNNTGTNFYNEKLPSSITNGVDAYFTVTSVPSKDSIDEYAGFVVVSDGEEKINHYALVGKLVCMVLKLKTAPQLKIKNPKGYTNLEYIKPKDLT
jgi:hypothetical protein